jgi:alpha-tubulin suppressor-like RCC1 family protein
MKFFSILTSILLFSSLSSATNKPPVIDAYVTVLDAQHLRSLYVNLDKTSDPNGKIIKTEVNFGDGFISANTNIIHEYAADGTYNLRIRAWDNKNAVSELNQSVNIASNLVFNEANDTNVYGPQIIKNNKSYSFNVASQPAGSLYKLVLTKKPPQGNFAIFLDAFSHLCYRFLGFNIFDWAKLDLNIAINGIDIFQDGEITKTTLKAEKFVNLKATNTLAVEIDHDHINQYSVEVKKVGFVKDTQPPVITLVAPPIDNITNKNFIPVTISDVSGSTTTYVWKTLLQASNDPIPLNANDINQLIITTTQSSFNIPLTEGLNYFIIQTVDMFGNKSDFYYLNNILLDTTPPDVASLSPDLTGTYYFHQIDGFPSVLPITKYFDMTFTEKIKTMSISGASSSSLTFTSPDRKSASGRIVMNNPGISQIKITLTDYANNVREYTYPINNIVVSEKPVLTITPGQQRTDIASNQNWYNFSYNVQSNYPFSVKIYANDILQQTSRNANGSVSVSLNKQGLNLVTVLVFYDFDSVFAANAAGRVINVDTIAPEVLAVTPTEQTNFYTNKFPFNIDITAVFNELVDSVQLNDGFFIPVLANNFSGQIAVNSAGLIPIKIVVRDVAGNLTTVIKHVNLIYDATVPIINTAFENNITINNPNLNLPIRISSETPTVSQIKLNGVDAGTFYDFNFDALIHLLQEGANTISLNVTDLAGNVATKNFTVNLDTKVPELTSFEVNGGRPIYTNHLPFTLDINALFSELIQTIQINDGLIQSVISPNFTGQIQINDHGLVPIKFRVTDIAGNVTDIIKNVQINFSDVAPTLNFTTPLLNLLTNNPTINFDGIASDLLSEIKLNGVPLTIGSDGKSFTGLFNAPADGLFDLIFDYVDKYGNIGQIKTRVRVLAELPDDVLNYLGPTLTFKKPFYELDPGGLFSGGPTGNLCETLSRVFGDAGIEEIDPAPYIKDFVDGKVPKIPREDQLMSFLNDDDDPIHKLKAGYLLVCKGFTIKPIGGDCQANRQLLKSILGKDPEYFIIKAIPGLLPSVQDFLTKRYNMCTGLNTDDLSCKDAVEFLPLVAELLIPGTGQALSSPVGQYIMEATLCKEMCDNPYFKTTPACLQPPLPNMPNFPYPKVPPLRVGPLDSSGPGWDWGGGGGSGGRICGGWPLPSCGDGGGDSGGFELCSSGSVFWSHILPSCGGSGSGGGGTTWIDIDGINGPNVSCSQLPFVFSCSPTIPIPNPVITIDPRIICDPLTWKFGDIYVAATNLNISPTVALISTIANCFDDSIPGSPSRVAPVITMIEPVQNQVVTGSTVRVRGYVNKTNTRVAIEDAEVTTVLSAEGRYFDVTIPVPADGKVNVHAIDEWGNQATTEVQLGLQNTGISDFAVGYGNVCAIKNGGLWCTGHNFQGELGDGTIEDKNEFHIVPGLESGVQTVSINETHVCAVVRGAAFCWGGNEYGEVGNGNPAYRVVSPANVVGLSSGVTAITAGYSHSCALINGGVKCWGWNAYGQLGDGTSTDSLTPVSVLGLETGVKSITSGFLHNCALMENNSLRCWGWNGYGQLGPNSQQVALDVRQVSAGGNQTCFVLNDGTPKCMGYNAVGAIGDGSTNNASSPTKVSSYNSNVDQIDTNENTSCAVDTQGAVKCWGSNFYGTFGMSTSETTFLSPIAITTLSTNVKKIKVGGLIACALVGSDFKCWGPPIFVTGIPKVFNF